MHRLQLEVRVVHGGLGRGQGLAREIVGLVGDRVV